MSAVSFRFYGDLNDFLPRERRHCRFTYDVPQRASVKDTIEALGVPHPEVDLILVAGRSQDFTCILQPGDDVAVYPVFTSIDISVVGRVGTEPLHPVRFALDIHLSKLGSLLRLSGFDALVLGDDAEIVETAARQARVVLTRDIGVLKRSAVRFGRWIRETDPELQLAEVLERFDLAGEMHPFARCGECNTPVVVVEAGEVATRLPPRTRAAFSEFWRCPGCDRVYWRGSHFDRLSRILERARDISTSRQRAGRKPVPPGVS